MKKIHSLMILTLILFTGCNQSPVLSNADIETAIAETQSAGPSEADIETAIAKTKSASPSNADIETAIAKTQKAAPTQSSSPTTTPIPSNTPLPESSPTSLVSITPVAFMDFEDAVIYALAHLASGQFLITIQLSDEVQGSYSATVGNELFKCEILERYPERLYCIGPNVEGGKTLSVQVFSEESNELVYEDEFYVPLLPTSTPKPKKEPPPPDEPTQEPTEIPPPYP